MPKYTEQNERPAPCVDIIVLNEKDEILLAKRSIEPQRDYWGIIGGRMEVGDNNIESAAQREVAEETGLDVEITHLVDVLADSKFDPLADPRFYAVQVVYLARKTGGSLRSTPEAGEFKWLPLEKIEKERLAFNHSYIISDYKKRKDKLIPAKRSFFSDYFKTGYEYLQNEYCRFAVNAVILNDRKEILMAQRSQWPYIGAWDFPGGHIYVNETIEDCLTRELREELGVESELGELFQVYSDKGHSPKFADVIAFYFAKIKSHDFVKNIEMSDFKYFSFNDLPEAIAYHNEGALEDIKEFLKVFSI